MPGVGFLLALRQRMGANAESPPSRILPKAGSLRHLRSYQDLGILTSLPDLVLESLQPAAHLGRVERVWYIWWRRWRGLGPVCGRPRAVGS